MRWRGWILVLLLVFPGLTGAAVCGRLALTDWAALQRAYRHFEQLAAQPSALPALLLADAQQDTFRLNLVADGVWTLQCLLLAAVGIHGLCTLPPRR